MPGRKKAAKKTAQGPRRPVAAPRLLQPDQFVLSRGVFVALSQITLAEVGPQAVGVVMTTRDQAEPYLSFHKAVSVGPLALLLLGDDEPAVLSVPASKVQFPATCRATGEPALLKALIVQIGVGGAEACPGLTRQD